MHKISFNFSSLSMKIFPVHYHFLLVYILAHQRFYYEEKPIIQSYKTISSDRKIVRAFEKRK